MQGASGSRIRVRIFCKASTGDSVQCTELLRLVWQFRGNNECGRVIDVFIPDIEVEQEEKVITIKKGKNEWIKVKNEWIWINFIIDFVFERR